MILVVLLLVPVAFVLFVVCIIRAVRNAEKSSCSSAPDSASESSSADAAGNPDRVRSAVRNGDIPDWEDLSDSQKTALSVWSEKGEPLEDLHLSDDK